MTLPSQLYLSETGGTAHQRRWYALHLQATLFDGVDLVCRWGRLSVAGGRERRQRFANEALALAALERIVKQRLRKGYVIRSAKPASQSCSPYDDPCRVPGFKL